jgi:hypothetical protein
LLLSLGIINADMEHPEKNCEANVYLFTGHNHQDKLYRGVAVELDMDPRDVNEETLCAYLMPNRKHLFVKMPAQEAATRLDYEKIEDVEDSLFDHCKRLQEARDVSRNAIAADVDRASKHLLIKFPQSLELSNMIFSPESGSDGLVNMRVRIYDVEYLGIPLVRSRIVWKMHVVDEQVRVVREQVPAGKSAADRVADAMKGMHFGGGRA